MDNCIKCGESFLGQDIFEYFLENTSEKDIIYPIDTITNKLNELFKGNIPEYYKTYSNIEKFAFYRASYYGWTKDTPKRFRLEIGIETAQYDGITFYRCPSCNCIWKRFAWSDPAYLSENDKRSFYESNNA